MNLLPAKLTELLPSSVPTVVLLCEREYMLQILFVEQEANRIVPKYHVLSRRENDLVKGHTLNLADCHPFVVAYRESAGVSIYNKKRGITWPEDQDRNYPREA